MTITAKNYAAQAQAGLKLWADATAHLYSKDAKAVREFSASIGDAVHFALPDNGRIMEDGLKGLQGIDLRLPYPAGRCEKLETSRCRRYAGPRSPPA